MLIVWQLIVARKFLGLEDEVPCIYDETLKKEQAPVE